MSIQTHANPSILFHVVTDDGGVTDLGAELGRRGKASTIRRGGGVVVTTGMFRMAPGRFQGNNEEEEELGEADEMGDLTGVTVGEVSAGLKQICFVATSSQVVTIKKKAESVLQQGDKNAATTKTATKGNSDPGAPAR